MIMIHALGIPSLLILYQMYKFLLSFYELQYLRSLRIHSSLILQLKEGFIVVCAVLHTTLDRKTVTSDLHAI